MTIREKFEGFGDKARAVTRAGAVFVGLALASAIVATYALLSASNGFASVMVLVLLIAAINLSMRVAGRSYERATEGDEE